ncbi:MAG TPA: hypothetical protein PLL26_04685 [Candidatus Dojkabacteria bacterium]|nr:hypothetical protein [Candidatus Dojkabacteria bacterium]
MQSALYDPQIVQSYHDEYLRLINYYMNTKRPSVFVRYFNIDIDQSIYDDKLEATYDLYHVSQIKFNIYDFTPSYYFAPVVNAAANVPDLRGQMMDATSSIVVYSIASPRIHDLLMFYGPVTSGEIFRVSGLRTAVNAVHSNPNVRWFELELEYAPITTTQELKILNHYVYDLTEERYISYDDYIAFTKKLNDCEAILDQLMVYYDSYNDLYQSNQLAPVEVNEAIIFFKKLYASKYKRVYEKYNLPYGYLDKVNFTQIYSSIISLPFVLGNYTYHVYNLATNVIDEYSWSITHKDTENDLDKMFLLTYQLLRTAFDWKF